ncbi:MAG: drug resistance transporter, EmrB/QacA subfamily [Thermoleophilia bacterium]|nr:drug resistance transporter, EmrB/QacA subfamily [Thermoleophilia bacterium]
MASTTASPSSKVVVDDPGHAPSPWWALVVVCFAQFMVVLDATITNVALPTIQTELKISASDLQWVINSYTLAFGGLLMLGGRASDLLGRRRIFIAGTLLFSLASLMNGLANSSEFLIIFRGVQGIGAALISPAALSVIMTSFAEGKERTKALGVWSAIAAGGAAVGLLLGGIITEYISWEWIFFINVPIGLAVIAAALRWVPESHADLGHRRFDLFGALSITAGLMLLVYTIVGTLRYGFWDNASINVLHPLHVIHLLSADAELSLWRTPTLGLVSIALLVAFVFTEARTKAPLVRLGLLRVRSLATANLAMLSVAAGMFAFFYFATLYIQQVLGYQPVKAGAAFLPFAFGIGIGAGTAQVAIGKLGVRLTGAIGLIVAAAGIALMGATLDVNGTYWWLFGGMIMMSVGLGWTFVPFTLIATTNVVDEEAGLASGVFNTSQQIGGAIGLAILSTVANNATKGSIKDLGRPPKGADLVAAAREHVKPGHDWLVAAVDGFQTAMYAGAGLLLVGLVLHVLFIRKKDVENIDVTAPMVPAA